MGKNKPITGDLKKIELIKAEIEKRITDNTFGAKMELIDLLAFIESLPEENPSEDLGFQTFASEISNVFTLPKERTTNTDENPLNWEYEIARHFYELGLNTRKK